MPQLARPKQDYREPSEFGFGPGPVPRGKEAAPISEGGVYGAVCRRWNSPAATTSAYERKKLDGRRATRRGYPGEHIG